VKVLLSEYTDSYCRVELKCQSSCQPDHQSYIWIKNGHELLRETSSSVSLSVYPADRYSCALKGYEAFISPSLPHVSLSPSGEIVEGRSVTLTCSSDANPAAYYTWYKEEEQKTTSNESQLIFSSIKSSDSGRYRCVAANQLGRKTMSPSGQLVEGGSVTLICSSDANPAANYTWYKEDEESPKVSGQNFIITDVRPEHSGNYSCEAQNTRGSQISTVHLVVVRGELFSLCSQPSRCVDGVK
ncbi:hypothetical protein GOODEAATRI_029025, partial [Goodea atripinnis]